MKRFSVVIGLIVITMVIFGCSKEDITDKWTEIEERGSIIVGLDDTFVPMGFRDNSGGITGFDVDMAKEVVKLMGLDIEFQSIDWNLKEQELNLGNIDMIWNGYSITDEREEKVNFSKAYLDNKQIIITLSSLDIERKEDLKGRIVATQNSSSALTAIEREGVISDFKNKEVVLFDTYNEAFMDLEAGRVEVVIADEVLAKYYMDKRGREKYKVVMGDFGDEEYGVGVRKGDKDLLENLNKALDEIKENGIAEDISIKWFGENIVK